MHQHLQSLKIIILALILATGISYVYAWTGPTEAPPGGNTPPPVNVGIEPQVKDGGLGLNTLSVFGDGYFQGKIGVGVVNPQKAVDVVGDIYAVGDVKGNRLCIGTDCRNAWPEMDTVGGGAYTESLITGSYTGANCITDNGIPTLITGGGFVCRFPASSCPSINSRNWRLYSNWTSTGVKYCQGNTEDFCPGSSCATSNHSFQNKVAETCSYKDGYLNYDVCALRGGSTCIAVVQETGCIGP